MKPFPLDEYLEQIGAPTNRPTTLDRLEELQSAQQLAIPYENFDIHLGRPIDLSQANLVDKLIRSKRGGYCFELNGLFLAALQASGFECRPLLGRVLLGGEPTGRSHQLQLVTIDGRDWIVDVGFAAGPRHPMPLEYDREMPHFGTTLRLIEHPLGIMLQSRTDEGWFDLYSFDLTPVIPSDIAYCNYFTSTNPSSFNFANRIAIRCTPNGSVRLLNFRCTTRSGDQTVVTSFPDDNRYLDELESRFGIELHASYDDLSRMEPDEKTAT